jgi:DNA-binding response OmpR family regulator
MSQARILIIDDEARIRETMKLALERDGYQVETAAGGAEGLALFGSGAAWDLVLLDQRMLEMEGREVLRRIHERSPTVPVVLVTAFGTVDLARDVLAAGASGFLQKPITPDELRNRVREVLRTHPKDGS